jgi:isoamylase
MFYMGDEYGHTKGGNNNTYCHDHYVSAMLSYVILINFLDILAILDLVIVAVQVNYFRWDKKEEQSSDLYRFCRLMTKFRK